MSRIEVTTCDHCKNNMPWPEVDAGVYGVDIHIKCFMTMTAPELVSLLSIDDIRVYTSLAERNENRGTKINSFVRPMLT